ncbi:LysR family transcriptional regulator [Pseudomonas rustica]
MKHALASLSVAQLRVLSVILDLKNLSKAALVVGSTQSLLSRHLASFREAFSDQLLVRQGREYVLTDRALDLVEPIKFVLQELERIGASPNFDPVKCKRRFTIAATDYVARQLLPDLMMELSRVAPGVSIEYVTWERNRFDWLATGKVDVAATMVNDAPPDFHGRMFGEDAPVCCMRAGHSLATSESIDETDFLEWPHIKISGGGDKDSFVDAFLDGKNLRREIALVVPFYFAALSVVEKSDSLLTIPWHIAKNYLRNGSYCWKPLSFVEQRFRYWVIWHSRFHGSPEQQWFRGLVHRYCEKLFVGEGVVPAA